MSEVHQNQVSPGMLSVECAQSFTIACITENSGVSTRIIECNIKYTLL